MNILNIFFAYPEKEEPLTIPYAQYDGLLTSDNAIEVTFLCSYEPVEGTLIIQTNVVLDNPKFEIKVKYNMIKLHYINIKDFLYL